MELGRYGVGFFGHARVLTVEQARVLESLGSSCSASGSGIPRRSTRITRRTRRW